MIPVLPTVAAGLLLVLAGAVRGETIVAGPGALRPIAPAAAAATGATVVAVANANGATTRLYRSLGRRQCEPGGETLAVATARLRDAGIGVTSAACGDSGQMVVAMCGAATTEIAIVEVRREDLARAGALGFRPLRDLPDARVAACSPARRDIPRDAASP
jgi:hypothetical protein